ncbi:MAG: 4-hydroxy-3-methylbut-2-enyl diphosphate reductase [Candidatus Moranbacteria bacterium]|nr:4-hydroxy-3-methylbut-2-enyl diphosphate reductase [Candidatus Moranbacteria bacterium]
MEITLSRFAGFCGGVKRAYDMVAGLDMSKTAAPIFILGSLVHNDDVMRKIEEKGIRKISPDDFISGQYGNIGTLIVSAHGVGPDIYSLAEERGIAIIDTTCPKVVQVQNLSSLHSKNGSQVVIIGDKNHKEVKGIFECGGKRGILVSDRDDLSRLDLDPDRKIVIISQTTQNKDFFDEASRIIVERYPQAEIKNTICLATENRQAEARKMSEENDVMIIIGSPDSANSTRLYEISKSLNQKSYFIERAADIDLGWFEGASSVGISAGASTPSWIIDEVMKKIGTLSAN